MVCGEPTTGIALVLIETLKFPWEPVYVLFVPDAVLTVTVVVPPDGTMFVPAFRRPPRFVGDCPKTMVGEFRLLNVGEAFCTTSVKLCVAFGVTPLLAVIVMG